MLFSYDNYNVPLIIIEENEKNYGRKIWEN